MVYAALQPATEPVSLDERLQPVGHIESTVEQSQAEVSEEWKSLIRSRAADLQADSAHGLTWDELYARMGGRWDGADAECAAVSSGHGSASRGCHFTRRNGGVAASEPRVHARRSAFCRCSIRRQVQFD